MLEPGAHFGFVIAAYAATCVIFTCLIIAIALDAKTQKKRVEKLIEAGLKRRSHPGEAQ